MPYVEQRVRDEMGGWGGRMPKTPGELNYAITTLILGYLGHLDHFASYTDLNAVVGALECAKLEFYRRAAVPYEEKKRIGNGDVGYDSPSLGMMI